MAKTLNQLPRLLVSNMQNNMSSLDMLFYIVTLSLFYILTLPLFFTVDSISAAQKSDRVQQHTSGQPFATSAGLILASLRWKSLEPMSSTRSASFDGIGRHQRTKSSSHTALLEPTAEKCTETCPSCHDESDVEGTVVDFKVTILASWTCKRARETCSRPATRALFRCNPQDSISLSVSAIPRSYRPSCSDSFMRSVLHDSLHLLTKPLCIEHLLSRFPPTVQDYHWRFLRTADRIPHAYR